MRKLKAQPVFDGLIAAAARLFMCTTGGHVMCLAEYAGQAPRPSRQRREGRGTKNPELFGLQ